MLNQEVQTSPDVAPIRHILVIDDDPLFRARVVAAARRLNFGVTACGSLRELEPMTDPCHFDLILMDYFLDGIQESLTGTDVANAIEGTPVILMSFSDHALHVNESWPVNIRKFVNKSQGVQAILNVAVALQTARVEKA